MNWLDVAKVCELADAAHRCGVTIDSDRRGGSAGGVKFGHDAGGGWVVIGGKRVDVNAAREMCGYILRATWEADRIDWAIEQGFNR